MTAGLLVLLLVLVGAEAVALLLRRRALIRREWARDEAADEAWLEAIRSPRPVFGMPMYVSPHLPDGVQALLIPARPFELPPMRISDATHDILADLERARLHFCFETTLVVRPSTAHAILKGVAL